MACRLVLINPNTNHEHTETMTRAARNVLPPNVLLASLTATRGAHLIEGYSEEAIAAAEVVEMVDSHPAYDAYVIGCYTDPGLRGARGLTRAPVVGLGESAVRAAALVSTRFGVVTALGRGVPEMEDLVENEGLTRRCVGIVAAGETGTGDVWNGGRMQEALVAAARELVHGRGAEALVLACGVDAGLGGRVADELGVPVVDAIAFAVLTAHALWRAGMHTSKRGALARPEPTSYRGMASLGGAGVPAVLPSASSAT